MMRRLGSGLLLLGTAVAAAAAPPESRDFVPGVDFLTVQPMQFDDIRARTSPYRFTASMVLIHPADTTPLELGFSRVAGLPPAVEPSKEIPWTPNANWTRFFDSDRTSLSPRLRLESKGQQLEIRPRSHSVWIQWRKDLP